MFAERNMFCQELVEKLRHELVQMAEMDRLQLSEALPLRAHSPLETPICHLIERDQFDRPLVRPRVLFGLFGSPDS